MHFRRMGEGAGLRHQRLQLNLFGFILEDRGIHPRDLQARAGNRALGAERGQVGLQSPYQTRGRAFLSPALIP
ncbi:hypothetical protein JI58_07135 [Marinosulfonomonas sp. PRT-SC04]|nr:hypothetical protein JI58_07135 [Marinosulfonomonas sp. PRT-SC04]